MYPINCTNLRWLYKKQTEATIDLDLDNYH